MIEYLKELWRFRHIPMTQVAVELKRGVREMRLGPIWWLLDPLLLMAVYYFVFKVIFQRGGDNYAVFLLAGLIPWQWFSSSLTMCTGSIRLSRGLVLQVKVPIFSLQLGALFVNLVYMLLGLVVVLAFAQRFPGFELLYLVPVIAVQGIFTLGLGSLLAIANVYAPDTQRLLGPILRIGLYLSPIMYHTAWVQQANLPELAKQIYMANPFVVFMDAYHSVLLSGNAPDLSGLQGWAAGSFLLLLLGMSMTQKMQGHLLKFV